ncbi:MAG: UDP-N-acetylmuramoyl-L-alanyl-D-glutamate--2,6-diaminopimelate ligase [Legionellaceae bacterium]|nr:UDP-N-acetylmuramoyl-L-alanyl-D-glutamate--2,6-diaminopimelate ligase [Legionellaceae bacterium]
MKLNILPDIKIKNLQNNSQKVSPGDVFLAYPGAASDGRNYVPQAITAGAIAVIYDPKDYSPPSCNIPCVAYPNLSDGLNNLACEFYQNPTRELDVFGVTGTNGKTTIAYQLAQAHALLNTEAAYMGTIGEGRVDALKPLLNTTPDALQIQQLCYRYVKNKIKTVCMEVSSHALCMGRVDGVKFNQAIYTNLSHEHLDYHKTFDAYAAAKAKLFVYPELKFAIINQDDAHAALMQVQIPVGCKALTYGIDTACDVRGQNIRLDMRGSVLDVSSCFGNFELRLGVLGRFNIYNSLAVLTSLLAYGYALPDVLAIMPKLVPSPGRMEQVANSPVVLVDYAHTPDALENALSTLAELKQARLFVVFGCGGDRDTSKRAVMGRIASQYADHVILTSDNPRTENPEKILDDIQAGLNTGSKVSRIEDRKQAIEHAIQLAEPDDIILIAGKGHEAYQEIGHERFAFSDQAVVRDLIRREFRDLNKTNI